MEYPFLKLVGGILLLWVAVKLVVPEDDHGEGEVTAADNLWRAGRMVAVADIVMSLDNVIAIAAAAESAAAVVDLAHASTIKTVLIVFGLVTSVPLIVAGSALLMSLLDRFPILVWAGAALLGWVAGDIMAKDPALERILTPDQMHTLHYWAAAAGAVFVLLMGYWFRQYQHRKLLAAPLVVDPPGPEEFPHKR
jgi:YjbE family integral membrane protein